LTAPLAFGAMREKSKRIAELARGEDAVSGMAQERGIRPAAAQERMGATPPDMTLTWSALFTDVFDDGTLGCNYGR